ncbi:MAG TPA: TraM recognition domain-containing protein, partial [Waddliaceae bacterium]
TTVIRNAGIGALFGVQSMAQLEKLYREKDAKILFSQAATKIFFATDGEEALSLSRMLGNTTVKESVNASGGLSNRESPSPLLDIADIANLESDGEYLAITTAGPIKLKKLAIWDAYKSALECPCPECPQVVVNEELEIAHTDNEKWSPDLGPPLESV